MKNEPSKLAQKTSKPEFQTMEQKGMEILERLKSKQIYSETTDPEIDNEKQALKEKADKKHEIEVTLKKIGFGSRYIKSYDPTHNQQKIIDISKNISKNGFYVAGSNGVGKTQILEFIARKYLEHNIHVDIQYCDTITLFQMIRSFKELPKNRILLIDDFGWESPSEFALTEFIGFIKKRYSNEMITYIMGNITLEDLNNRNSDAYDQLVDMFLDKTWMETMEIGGKSIRQNPINKFKENYEYV